jgi:Predicted membrane protein
MTIVRVFTGWLIFRYGLELFHINELLDFLKKENFPFPVFSGYAAKIIELVGGACLILGIFTRWATPPLMAVMYGVIYVTANGSIFDGEFPFLFLLLFAVFFINGAGKWSLDNWLSNRKIKSGGVGNGLLVLICCLLGSCTLNKPPQAHPNREAPKLSIVQKLKEFEHLTVAEQIALYKTLKTESPAIYDFDNENQLTMYGYMMLWDGKVKDAIEIFKLIAQEFPHSANAYDSLGEAYLNDGQSDLSLTNYEKSLAMNPDNFNAEDQIERIKNPQKTN